MKIDHKTIPIEDAIKIETHPYFERGGTIKKKSFIDETKDI